MCMNNGCKSVMSFDFYFYFLLVIFAALSISALYKLNYKDGFAALVHMFSFVKLISSTVSKIISTY